MAARSSTIDTHRVIRPSRAAGSFGGAGDQRIISDPIEFPRLAAVIREKLLEVTGSRADLDDHKAHKNGSVSKGFLVDEFSAAIMEFTHRRCARRSDGAVGEVQAPLIGFWVVQTQREGFNVTLLTLDFQLNEIRATIPDLPDRCGPVILGPRRRFREWMQEPLQVSFPHAKLVIEVVLTAGRQLSRHRSHRRLRSDRLGIVDSCVYCDPVGFPGATTVL